MEERIGGAEEGGERGVEGWVLDEKQLQRERDELRGEERRKPQWKAEGAL